MRGTDPKPSIENKEAPVLCEWCGKFVPSKGSDGVSIAVSRNETVRVHAGECEISYKKTYGC